MKLSELFLNRFLYKDTSQDMETKSSEFLAADSTPDTPVPLASGGAAQDINTGNVQIDGKQLEPGTYPTTVLDVSNWGWGQTCAFSSTDADTVSWGAGTFNSADGTSYSISAGDTGNMAAKTYIYLSLLDSETEYQTTTTSADSVGLGKVLIAVAENGATDATYMLSEATQIVGDNILANTIDASKITAGQLVVGTNVDIGTAEDSAGVTTIIGNVVDTGFINALSITVLGAVTAGSLTGLTVTGGTIRSAASGTRMQITNATQRMDGINDNGDVVSSSNWSSTSAAVLKLAPTYDARRALEIAIPASFAGAGTESDAKGITIANEADSICIDITDGGLYGLYIAGGCDTSAIYAGAATGAATLDIEGGLYPAIEIEQNGASSNSFGIRLTQSTAAVKHSIYIDNNANANSSYGIDIDRDGNSANEVIGMRINTANAGAGNGLGIQIYAKTTGIDIVSASTGIDLSGSSTYHMKTKIDNTDPTSGGGAATGRIPIDVGGSTRYIPYY